MGLPSRVGAPAPLSFREPIVRIDLALESGKERRPCSSRRLDRVRSIDLHLESMAASRERAVAGRTSGLIEAGEHVAWEAQHLGLRWRVTSHITEFDRPRRFVDEMLEGPFARFRHEHDFEPHGTGTRMTDVIEFRTRWRPLSPLADVVAGIYLRRLIRIRNAVIQARAEAS